MCGIVLKLFLSDIFKYLMERRVEKLRHNPWIMDYGVCGVLLPHRIQFTAKHFGILLISYNLRLNVHLCFVFFSLFQMESGGTVLSTNWSDVGKRKVEVNPPDDMEWKKY